MRDSKADYLAAYIAEYEAYKAAGEKERAAATAVVLRKLGHNVNPPTPPKPRKEVPVETKVEEPPLERAVDEQPKRRVGRPTKTESAAE